jgi:hypothetical protein
LAKVWQRANWNLKRKGINYGNYDYKLAKISYNEKEPTEYIRTDAFIKKAYSFVKRKLNDYIVVDIDNKYEGIDGLFFEDFRKYMEGE